MNGGTKQLLKMYIIALVLTLIAEWIGLIKWQIGIITILLVPFFHTLYLGVAFGPKFLGRFIKVYDVKDSAFAAALIVPATYALMARYGTLVGPNAPKLLKAGIALILQEAGNNWGSIAIALPIFWFCFGKISGFASCHQMRVKRNFSQSSFDIDKIGLYGIVNRTTLLSLLCS